MSEKELKTFIDSYNSINDIYIQYYRTKEHFSFYIEHEGYRTVKRIAKSAVLTSDNTEYLTSIFNKLIEEALWPDYLNNYTTKEIEAFHTAIVKELDQRLIIKGL